MGAVKRTHSWARQCQQYAKRVRRGKPVSFVERLFYGKNKIEPDNGAVFLLPQSALDHLMQKLDEQILNGTGTRTPVGILGVDLASGPDMTGRQYVTSMRGSVDD